MSASADRPALLPDDEAVIAAQLGRNPRDVTGIAVRCRFGYPAVIETAPVLSDGTPNPTLLYLTCPALAASISGIEAGGGVRAFKAACGEDPGLWSTIEQVAALYRARRRCLAAERGAIARLEAGIGGPAGPDRATCLHAHAAALLAVRTGWLPAEATLLDEVERVWADLYRGLSEPWCLDRRCSRWTSACRRAVIDVGTISVRLLVADVTTSHIEDLVRRADITRLGEGLQSGGSLLPTAKARTAEVVARFLQEARSLGASDIALVGTSAARDAADGSSFVDGLGVAHGIRSTVLPGEEEAALAYSGASIDLHGDPVVLDVGGGSTELIRRCSDGSLDVVSLALGASRATDRWIRSDPPTASELALVEQDAREQLRPLKDRFGSEPTSDGLTSILAGVAGTVTTLACLDAGLERYNRAAIHLRRLTIGSVRLLLGRLAGMTLAERSALPCVQAGRAPVIVAGAIIVLAAMETLGYEEVVVSERDLLDGLVVRGSC